MMKFLRKHNKKLLAVFMALLMVVFLGGTALDSWMRPDPNFVLATSRFGKINNVDRQRAVASTDLLSRIGMTWSQLSAGQPEPLTPIDWYLLLKEAQEYNTGRDISAVRTLVSDENFWERITNLARVLGIKPERVVEAFAMHKSILDVLGTLRSAAAPSEAEIRHVARLSLDRAVIRAAVLPAAMFLDPTLEFSEQEIKAHFEKYRDRERGKGLDFGYRIAESVRVQYLRIDKEALAGAVGVANAEQKARRYYEENREKDPALRRPDDGSVPPHEQPPEYLRAVSAYLDWDEAKEKVLQIIRNNHAEEMAGRIGDWLLSHLQEPWLDVPRGDDGYKVPPAAAERLEAYSEAVGRLPTSLSFRDVVSVGMTDLFTRDESANVPEIGTAAFQTDRGQPIALTTLAFQTRGIVPKVPEERGVNPMDFIAPFETSSYMLKDSNGNRFLFRVVETREAHAPATALEVRDRIVQDLRMLHAMETAKARAQNLYACLDEDTNLKQAFEEDPDLMARKSGPEGKEAGAFEPTPFSKMNMYQATHGRRSDSTFITGGVGFVPNDVVDRIFQLEESHEKFGVFELRDRSAVLAVEWVRREPTREDEFMRLREQIAADLTRARQESVVLDWVTPAKIRARNRFAWVDDRTR